MTQREPDDVKTLWIGRILITAAMSLSWYAGGWSAFGVVLLAALGGAALGIGA